MYAGVELGGTTWRIAISGDDVTNIHDHITIDTTIKPQETISQAIEWLKTKSFISIGIASFGPIDLNPNSSTYGYITSTPKEGWTNTDVLGPFKIAFPQIPIAFETDVNAPAVYEVFQGGHDGDISSACYITIGTGVGVGVCVNKQPVHGFMHPEGGHMFVPLAEADIKSNFKGVCPFHGSCVEGMVASAAIAARTGLDRKDLHSVEDQHQVWETLAHYIAYLCANLTLTVSPQVIVIGGGIAKRKLLFNLIRQRFSQIINKYVKYPAIEKYIVPSVHDEVGLISSLQLARLVAMPEPNVSSNTE